MEKFKCTHRVDKIQDVSFTDGNVKITLGIVASSVARILRAQFLLGSSPFLFMSGLKCGKLQTQSMVGSLWKSFTRVMKLTWN